MNEKLGQSLKDFGLGFIKLVMVFLASLLGGSL